MLVRLYGFALTPDNSHATLDDLFASLATTSGQADTSLGIERRIYIDNTDATFVKGLVVTVKDQKTFCELVGNNSGKLVVSVNNLKGKNKLMEFNFFIVNRSNGLGIYQHYFQSCSASTFGLYLRRRYRAIANKELEGALKTLVDSGSHTVAKEKALRSSHKPGLSFALLLYKKSLEKVLSEFTKIKGFEYEVAALEPEYLEGVPIANYVNKLRQKVTFKPTIAVGVLAKAIQATVNQLSPRSGHVSAVEEVDGEEIPVSIRIANIPEHFGEEDYDVVAGKLNQLDVDAFAGHKVMTELQQLCEDTYKHVFMKTVKTK